MLTLARMHGLGLGQILLQSGILLHRHGIAHIWLDAQQLQSFGTAVLDAEAVKYTSTEKGSPSSEPVQKATPDLCSPLPARRVHAPPHNGTGGNSFGRFAASSCDKHTRPGNAKPLDFIGLVRAPAPGNEADKGSRSSSVVGARSGKSLQCEAQAGHVSSTHEIIL